MSRIYDALKKLEAERSGERKTNGQGNGHGNGHGNGGGNGRRRLWRWLFGNGRPASGEGPTVNFQLGPDAEEAYQRLGTNLLVAPGVEPGHGLRLVGVLAARHGEGATTTASVFASIVARRRGGRVAVVEANLRSPSFDRVFGCRPGPGFADLIRGEQPVTAVVQQTPLTGLVALPCGDAPAGPSALFDSPGLSAALEQLRQAFDFVVFDLPPANVYGDAFIICPRLDATMVVIEADHTRIPEVERTRRNLERVGARLAGSVLNRRRNYIPTFLEELL